MSYNCPYCQHSFERSQVKIDEKGGVPFFYCPNPKKKNGRKICGKLLPLDFLTSKTISISIIGSPYVGKTYYLLSLLYQLKNNNTLKKLGVKGDILGGRKENPKIYSLLDDLANGKTLEVTNEVHNIVIDLSIIKNNKRKQIYLSIFDNPGENSKGAEELFIESSNIFQSDGIIILIGPKQLLNYADEIRSKYLYEQTSFDDTYDIYDIIKNISLLIETQHSNKSFFERRNNKKNIAFTISKFDQINDHLNLKIPFDNTGDNFTVLNKKYKINSFFFQSLSNEIFRIINDNDIRLKTIMNSSSFNTSFFGVKVADVNEEGKIISMTNSQGVILPFIWILNQLNLLK